MIRPARVTDSAALREIERAAGERFRTVGMDAVADDDPPSVAALNLFSAAGRSWVAVDASDRPTGFVLVDVLDGGAHIEQISVHPMVQGRGLGRALVEWVARWAAAQHCAAVTLTTFSEVPWNRPLYEHLGFVVMPEEDIGPELRAVRDVETAHGLDPTTRVCMRLAL
ncbi:MAG TPA: GNAT family N-acetyltransferase [Acidimicrobiales bacterium]|nr:GNAT family N-acetyltransferase [Acidimicrobiales bacterium]